MAKTTSTFVANQIARNAAQGILAASSSDLENKAVANVAGSVFQQGDIIKLASIVDADAYKQEFKNGDVKTYAYFLVVEVENNGVTTAKNLYFNTLTKSVSIWQQDADQGFIPSGNAISAADSTNGKAFYQDMLNCPTALEQLKALQKLAADGKNLKVDEVKTVQTARYQGGKPIGLRNAQVPCFVVA